MYKILILTNNLGFNIEADCEKVRKYFADRNIQNTFTFKAVNIPIQIEKYKTIQGYNSITGQPSQIDYMGVTKATKDICRLHAKDGEYQAVVLAWNLDNFLKHPTQSITSWADNVPLYPKTEFLQIAINKYDKDRDAVWKKLSHEILHSYCFTLNRLNLGLNVLDEMDNTIIAGVIFPFYKNDTPYATDSNYAQTLDNIKPHISKLYPKVGYKYFSPAEVAKWKLKPELWQLLDTIRGECGFPFNINSGLRTKAENDALANSVSDSAHLSGLAVDIACTDSSKRDKIVTVAKANGVKRIGIGKTFVHLDVDTSKVQSVMWHYY